MSRSSPVEPPVTLPSCLQSQDDGDALRLLQRYYAPGLSYTGAAFDTWDSTGTRQADVDRFTADDLVAVSFLAVWVPARPAYALLVTRRAEFTDLLVELGPDRDLADEPPLEPGWRGWPCYNALLTLPGVGETKASKLLARKRPRLRPVYDDVVTGVLGTQRQHWEPIRQALAANDKALHHRLLRLRAAAGLPEQVSALRVLDVLAWMEGSRR